MAHQRRARLGRREAIALFGLLGGMASAALLTQFVDPPTQAIRVAI